MHSRRQNLQILQIVLHKLHKVHVTIVQAQVAHQDLAALTTTEIINQAIEATIRQLLVRLTTVLQAIGVQVATITLRCKGTLAPRTMLFIQLEDVIKL